MKFSHATLYIVTSATFALGALALQGCSDSTPSTVDASPTVDSAASDSSADSGQESSVDSAQSLIDSGQEASIDSAADSAADAAADSSIVLPLDASLDVALASDAIGLSDGSGDSSDAHVE